MNMGTNHQLSSVHSNFQDYVCVGHFPHSLAAWNESPLPAYHPTVLADTDTYLETLIELALIRSHMIKSFVIDDWKNQIRSISIHHMGMGQYL